MSSPPASWLFRGKITDVHGVAACLARAVHELVMTLFALNRQFLVNDRTALEEVAGFAHAPQDFGPRVSWFASALLCRAWMTSMAFSMPLGTAIQPPRFN